MKNQKGFTLIEVIATVTILGIIMAVAVPAVYRYLTKSKTTAYDTMEKSAYSAAKNYMIEHSVRLEKTTTAEEKSIINNCKNKTSKCKEISIAELVENDYLETPTDPNKQDRACIDDGSVVKVINVSSNNAIDEYRYYINIVCPSGYKSKDVVFPKK